MIYFLLFHTWYSFYTRTPYCHKTQRDLLLEDSACSPGVLWRLRQECNTPLWDESPVCEHCLCVLLSSLSWLSLGDFFEIPKSLKCYHQGQFFPKIEAPDGSWLSFMTRRSHQNFYKLQVTLAYIPSPVSLSKTRVQTSFPLLRELYKIYGGRMLLQTFLFWVCLHICEVWA